MKQTTKKIASLALSFALALTLFAGAPVFATEDSTTSTPVTGSPVITNYSVDVRDGNKYYPGGYANITIDVYDAWAEQQSAKNTAGANSNGGAAGQTAPDQDAENPNGAVLPSGEEGGSTTATSEPAKKEVRVRARISTPSFSGKDATATATDGRFKFEFKDILYNGGDNTFKFDLIVEESGEPREVITLNLPIPQCSELPEPTPAPTPAPPEVPKIMVKDFTFGGNSVEAGKEFTLELTLFTTSGNTNLEDVMVGLTFPSDSKNVSLASGSMNTYVGTMGPNATRTISYKMVTSATMEPGSVNITVQLTSKNGEAASSPISIPVTQPERFEITNIEAPETMMMGEEGYLSVTFVNKGKSSINNLTAEIQGENLANPGQSQFLGNVAAGTENSVDFSVMASAEGVINGKVILSYENSKGEVATVEKEFSCTVEAMPVIDDPGMMDPGMMDPTMGEDVEGGMPIWGWALIVVGVGAVAAVAVVVIRKKQAAKKLAQLEDEDEDI